MAESDQGRALAGRFVLFAVLPLLPLGIELLVLHFVQDTTLTVTLAMYALTNCALTRVDLYRTLSLIAGGLGLAAHGASLQSHQPADPFTHWFIASAIGLVLILIGLEELERQ